MSKQPPKPGQTDATDTALDRESVTLDDDLLFEPGGALRGALFQSLEAKLNAGQTPLEPGQDIGRFVLDRQLGKGGMGEVFAARDKELGRRVALKVISSRSDQAWTDQLQQRFRREAKMLSRLDHPHVCKIYDLYEHEGETFLVLELVAGTTLDESAATLKHKDKLKLASEIMQGIAHAHQQGVVHRDLKPANIMVTAETHAKILDFGISRGYSAEHVAVDSPESTDSDRADENSTSQLANGGALDRTSDHSNMHTSGLGPLTHQATRLGTPAYMSPEQARGDQLGPPTDLFSLGMVICHLFGSAQRTGLPELSDVSGPRALRKLASDLLAARAIDRPTAQQAFERLERIRTAGRRLLLRAAAAVLLAVALGSAVKYTTDINREREQALRALAEAEEVTDFLVSVFEVADPSEARGADISARELLDRGSDRIAVELADQPLARARIESALGHIYRNLGIIEKAQEHHLVSLGILEGQDDPDPARIGLQTTKLAHVAISDGRYPDALALLDKAAGLVDPEEDPDSYYSIMESQAIALRRLGRLAEAEQKIDLALAATEVAPEVADDRATYLAVKGLIELGLGRGSEAVAVLTESLEMHQQQMGEDHPDTAVAHNNLALALRSEEDYEQALFHFERAVEIDRKVLGEQHPDYGLSLDNLALVKVAMNDLVGAEALMRKAIAIFEAANGELHPNVDVATTNLSFVLRMQGRFQQARAAATRALLLVEQRTGQGSVESVYPLRSLALLEVEVGDDERAIQHLEKAVAILETDSDAAPRTIAQLGSMLIESLTRQGRVEEAHARCRTLPALLAEHNPSEDQRDKLRSACKALDPELDPSA